MAGGAREQGVVCRIGWERSLYPHQDGRVVKALDLRSNGHMSAWVRTPLLVNASFFSRLPVTLTGRTRWPSRGPAGALAGSGEPLAGSGEPPAGSEGRGAALGAVAGTQPAGKPRGAPGAWRRPVRAEGAGSNCSGPVRAAPPGQLCWAAPRGFTRAVALANVGFTT